MSNVISALQIWDEFHHLDVHEVLDVYSYVHPDCDKTLRGSCLNTVGTIGIPIQYA